MLYNSRGNFIQNNSGLLVISLVLFICLGCLPKKRNKEELIKGTWKGEVRYIKGIEIREFSPLTQDSTTRLIDSTFTIKDITVDFGKDKAMFFGAQDIIRSGYTYGWEEGGLYFKKQQLTNQNVGGVITVDMSDDNFFRSKI